jgi:type 1 glutamine amidotransferase
VAVALAVSGAAAAPTAVQRVLVFTKTTGFRHSSIPVAIQAVTSLGEKNGFTVEATEDAGTFTDAGLARYEAVVFLLTTGDVLNDAQQASFQRFVNAGHGWVGVHSASDTEYDWAWYGALVGAYFSDHPAIQPAAIDVAEPRNGLPARWMRTDEWYNFQSNPRPAVHVLATIDESTYSGGGMGADHPIAWWHDYDGGRAWYTAGGHTEEAWAEPLFLAHVLSGIKYALNDTVPPRILSLSAKVSGRRVSVTVRYWGCGGCTGELQVGKAKAKLIVAGGIARGTSPKLPRGHARVVVVLSGDGGVKLTSSHPIVVR